MNVKEFIESGKILVLDGATGTHLMKLGLESGECPELWNVDRPEDITNMAKMYYEAGADAVLTNTFGGSSIKLGTEDLHARAYELGLAGVKNALAAKPAGKFVFGSMGPSGEFLEPMGLTTEEQMVEAFKPQVEAFRDGGVDAVMIETFTDINEQKCAIKAVKEFSDLPFMCSMTYDKTPKGYATIMGVTIEQAAEELSKEGALVVGSNCGHGFNNMLEIASLYKEAKPDLNVLAKPNAGVPVFEDGQTKYTEDPEYFRQHIQKLIDLKPSIIGGCCGTHAGHTKIIREAVDAAQG